MQGQMVNNKTVDFMSADYFVVQRAVLSIGRHKCQSEAVSSCHEPRLPTAMEGHSL